jgi:DNA-binding transcriptional ArsR family regulator
MARKPAPPPAIHWVDAPEQIAALASPIRQGIVDRLEAHGPCSVRELAAALDRRPDALYYHVKRLVELELLTDVGTRPTQTAPETLYDLRHRRWHIAYAPQQPDNAAALRKLTRAMLRTATRDFDAGLDHPDACGHGPERNLWSLRLEASLTAAERREVVGHLEAIVSILRKPRRTRRGRLTALTWVLAPLSPATTPSD